MVDYGNTHSLDNLLAFGKDMTKIKLSRSGMPWRIVQDEFDKFCWIHHERQNVPRYSICHRTRCKCENASMMHAHVQKPMLNDKPDVTLPIDVADSERRKEVLHHEEAPGEAKLKKNSGDKKATFNIKAKSIPVTPKTLAASSA